MESTSLMGLRANSAAREQDEKRTAERKKAAIVLALEHLSDHGYIDTVETLQRESGVSLDKVQAADNIDLIHIIQEFQTFYEMKFQKKPKLMKRSAPGSAGSEKSSSSRRATPRSTSNALPRISRSNSGGIPTSNRGGKDPVTSSKASRDTNSNNTTSTTTTGDDDATHDRPWRPSGPSGSGTGGGGTIKTPARSTREKGDKEDTGQLAAGDVTLNNLGVSVTPVTRRKPPTGRGKAEAAGAGGRLPGNTGPGEGTDDDGARDTFFENRLLKPLPDFGYDHQMRELAQVITRDIFLQNPNVHWKDIAGLDGCKRVLKEAVLMPVKYPQLFQGILAPWKGMLLFGPPGTGKTMLAKAVATECNTTFFNVSASTLVSKWRGDSEKLIRVLFELARYHSPSTIFLDELDALMGQRSAEGSEHEGSRRMKTELLIQMDGLAKSDSLVFVMAATNLPWLLDQALLRRLEKRIYVPLPNPQARRLMFQHHLGDRLEVHGDGQLDEVCNALASKTEGYSGSDIYLVCRESAMRPLRRLMNKLEATSLDGDTTLAPDQEVVVGPVTVEDVTEALAVTKSTGSAFSAKYQAWMNEFGAQ